MSENTVKEKSIMKPRAYIFALAVIKFIDSSNLKDFTLQVLHKQLIRAGTSIGANITEAQSASSKKDFINFYTYALKSANETKYWLKLIQDSGKAPAAEAERLHQEAGELANMLASSIIKLKNS